MRRGGERFRGGEFARPGALGGIGGALVVVVVVVIVVAAAAAAATGVFVGVGISQPGVLKFGIMVLAW